MRVLLDQGTPVPLRQTLLGHEVATAYERGWSTFKNGELLAAAELDGYEVFVTTDKNLRYQQNLSLRRISIVVLSTTSWPRINLVASRIGVAVDACIPGSYTEVAVP